MHLLKSLVIFPPTFLRNYRLLRNKPISQMCQKHSAIQISAAGTRGKNHQTNGEGLN